MKRILPYLMIMVLLGAASGAWGQDDASSAVADAGTLYAEMGDEESADSGAAAEDEWGDMTEIPPVHYVLEPELRTWLGYNIVDVQGGSNRAAEYIWPHSSATGGILLHYTPLPQRLDFELDWVNKHDYQSEFSYAYRDILKLDYRGWALYHNLDHLTLLYTPAPVDLNPGIGVRYGVTAMDNRVFLRLKWPDRAYHAFFEYRQFNREGTLQQRFRTGTKTARSRDIDWITRRYTAGINGHLGPVEAEYTHRAKVFNPHGDVEMLDVYAGFPGFGRRLVHNNTPRLEGSSETIKIHTDMTGRIVGAVTLTAGEKKNTRTWAEVDYSRAYADFTIIPFADLTVAFKYRFNNLQTHSPAVEGVNVSGTPGVTNDPIDRTTHTAEVTARYSPMNEFSVKAGYRFDNVQRDMAHAWSEEVAAGPPTVRVFPFQTIPYQQNIHQMSLGMNARPLMSVHLKGSVSYTYVQDPAYPVEAVNSFKGRFDATWTPHYSVMTDLYYRFSRDDNNTANMEAARDNAGVLATWTPLDRLSLYANYDYSRYENERDVRLLSGIFPAEAQYPVHRVPYRDRSHLYSVGAAYRFAFPVTVDAEFHQSWSRSMFRTSVFEPVNAVASDGLGELTDAKIRETGGMFRAGYDLPKGWGTSVEYKINDYQDLQDKPQNGPQDSTVHTVMLLVKKEW